MPNPFFVQPASTSEGISELVNQFTAQKKLNDIKKKGQEAFASKDPTAVAQFMIEYPEAAEAMKIWETKQFFNDKTRQNAAEARRRFLMNPTKENAATIMAERNALLDAEGVPAEKRRESNMALEAYERDPEGYMQQIIAETAAMDPEWYLDFTQQQAKEKPTSNIQDFEYYKKLRQTNPEEAEKFAYQAGIIPKGAEVKPTDIDDYVADAEACRAGDMAACMRNDDRLTFKRQQAPEAYATTRAEQQAETEFVQQKAYLSETGKALAEIENATARIHAKGELTDEEKKANAKRGVTNKLAQLAKYYTELDRLGGIINVENPTLDNIWAGVQSSGMGQFVGRMFGTKPQSIRASIRSMKPLLLNDIRQSTDMASRGLDSEKELEFYLQAATDEQRDIQSNIAAMIVLDEAYGNGQISSLLRQLNISPEYIEEIRSTGEMILNGSLLSGEERQKRIEEGRTVKPGKPGQPPAPRRPPMPSTEGMPGQTLPPGVTEADIEFTMKKHGVTREQVLQRLGVK